MPAANLVASKAILKTRYPEGRLPLAMYTKFPFLAAMSKKEDFDGENYVVALQTENPQGSSAIFQQALGSLQQGTYNRFLLTRIEHFGIVRITAQAMRAAQKSTGSLVDLWRREMDGSAQTEMKGMEIYMFGAGNGVLGTISSGQTTATITLTKPDDAVKFDLLETVQAVSDTTLSPVTRGGTATITAIDRVGGTLTVATTWNDGSNIPGITATDSLVRAGDGAAAGVSAIETGLDQWLVGGTSPGTLFGLNRNADPVRLAGQFYDATGVPMEDAVIEAESLRNLQYPTGELVGWFNPRDIAQIKKTLGGKVAYPRVELKTEMAGVSFKGIEFEGDNGPIKLMTSPFCTRNEGYLLEMDSWAYRSMGPAPQLLDWDGPEFLRVASDAAYEARYARFGNPCTTMPVANIRMTNFGV